MSSSSIQLDKMCLMSQVFVADFYCRSFWLIWTDLFIGYDLIYILCLLVKQHCICSFQLLYIGDKNIFQPKHLAWAP